MEKNIVVEIRAPHSGAVEDLNVYVSDAEKVKKIIENLQGNATFIHNTKAEIDSFDLVEQGDSLNIRLQNNGYKHTHDLGKASVEITYGGLAYNVFQNLFALNNSLENRLELRPIIGVPRKVFEELGECKWFIPADIRRSLMIVCDNYQLNLVTKESRLHAKLPELEVPDVAVISSYPRDETTKELERVISYKEQQPHFRAYLNPGSMQLRIGIDAFKKVMPIFKMATMKLDEAGKFLDIENNFRNRSDYAKTCLRKFAEMGVDAAVLNDSEKGSYMIERGVIYHADVFPKEPVKNILPAEIENFSGCGDAIFSGMLYSMEVLELKAEEKLSFANSLARLISLLRGSNLYCVDDTCINKVFKISMEYAGMVKEVKT